MNNKNSIYFTYRKVWDNKTNCYDVSYYNNLQYKDYVEAGLTKMIDGNSFIPDSRITKEVVSGVASLRRAGVLEYNPAVDEAELIKSLKSVATSFGIEVITAEEMKTWIRDNTDLVETEDGVFEIYPAGTDEMTGEATEAKYLTIS